MTLTPGSKPHWKLLQVRENPEHDLFDSVISEFNDIAGFDADFWIRKVDPTKTDQLYGEDTTVEWDGPYRTSVVYKPTEETKMFDFMGFSSDDHIQYMEMARTVFWRDVQPDEEYHYMPKVGDLIKTLWNNMSYEIMDVGSEEKVFQGKKMMFEFICKPYRYGHESKTADDFIFTEPSSADTQEFDLVSPGLSSEFDLFDENDLPENMETYTQTVCASGEYVSPYGDNDFLEEESNKINKYNDIDTKIYGF